MKRGTFLRRLFAAPLATASLFSLSGRPRRKLANTLLFKRETTFRTEPDERKWLKLKATSTVSIFVGADGVWRDHNGRRIQTTFT